VLLNSRYKIHGSAVLLLSASVGVVGVSCVMQPTFSCHFQRVLSQLNFCVNIVPIFVHFSVTWI